VIDERDLFDRTAQRWEPPEPSFERLLRRRDRKRRNRRIGATALAVAITIVIIGSFLASFSRSDRLPASPEPTPAGAVITTIAGNGSSGSYGDGGPAIEAELTYPSVVGFDQQGNLYVSESGRIRKIGPTGVITTVVGPPAGGEAPTVGDASSVVGGGTAIDDEGNLYVVTNDGAKVMRVTPSGEVSTVAGTGQSGFSGDGGPAAEAQVGQVYANSAVDAAGNLYIADLPNNRIRKVDTNGIITTIAGTGNAGFAGDGGPATKAELNGPTSVAIDGRGNLYIADALNFRFRKIDTEGIITTVAGNGEGGFSGDGAPATNARVGGEGVWADSEGNFYLIGGSRVRKVDTNGIITTVAGNGTIGFSGDGGPATEAQLNEDVFSAIIGPDGALYIADSNNNRIRKVVFNDS
jgi:sugar lactone lactonase YvrE